MTSRLARQSWTLDSKGASRPDDGKGLNRGSGMETWKQRTMGMERAGNRPRRQGDLQQEGQVSQTPGREGPTLCSVREGASRAFQAILSHRALRQSCFHELRSPRMPVLPFILFSIGRPQRWRDWFQTITVKWVSQQGES